MKNKTEPIIKTTTKKVGKTQIIFYPDFARFGLKSYTNKPKSNELSIINKVTTKMIYYFV